MVKGFPGVTIVAPGVSLNVENGKVYNTRFFYNSKVVPSMVDALLAKKCQNSIVLSKKSEKSQKMSDPQIAPKCYVT